MSELEATTNMQVELVSALNELDYIKRVNLKRDIEGLVKFDNTDSSACTSIDYKNTRIILGSLAYIYQYIFDNFEATAEGEKNLAGPIKKCRDQLINFHDDVQCSELEFKASVESFYDYLRQPSSDDGFDSPPKYKFSGNRSTSWCELEDMHSATVAEECASSDGSLSS
jgi:hypothetical protein